MSVEQPNVDSFLKKIIAKYHFMEKDYDDILKVYEEMQISLEPYAIYRMNQRATGVKIIDDNQTAIVAMTLGSGIDRLSDRYTRNDKIEEAYILDCISNELLLAMYVEFNRAYARFHRRYVMRYLFLGNEIPVTKIPELLDEIKNKTTTNLDVDIEKKTDSNEITANAYGTLFPIKSVVFYAILSENPKQICEGICMSCNNVDCENRITSTKEDQIETGRKQLEMKQNLSYGFQRIFGS